MTHCIRSVGNVARGSLLTALMFFSPLVAPHSQAAQSARGASRIMTETGQRGPRDFERPAQRLPPRPRRVLPSHRDVAEDFKQLQLKNYSLSQEAGRGAPLDYVRIRKEAAEVKKRASRLRMYLLLPEPNKEAGGGGRGEEPASTETLTAAATSLNALVKSFVWNPMFQQPGVIDMELSSKASRDLESIIRLSEQIRRRAEGLGKGAGRQ